MKGKIIKQKVYNCEECSYRYRVWGRTDKIVHLCELTQREVETIIPDWCPLKDIEETE